MVRSISFHKASSYKSFFYPVTLLIEIGLKSTIYKIYVNWVSIKNDLSVTMS